MNLLPNQKYRNLGHQVRQDRNRSGSLQKNAALNGPVLGFGQRFEIVNGEKVDVRRIIPVVRKQLRFRSAPGPEMSQAHRPVAEIRERYDGAPPHSKHLTQYFQRFASLLQGLAE